MKNSTKGFAPIAIVIIVAAVLVLAGGGYWWWQNKAEVAVPVINQQAISSSQQVATDETASWKTYRNDQYGFEFQYPTEIQLANLVPLKVTNMQRLDVGVFGIYIEGLRFFSVLILNKPEGFSSLKVYVENQFADLQKAFKNFKGDVFETTVGDKKGFTLRQYFAIDPESYDDRVYLEQGSYLITVNRTHLATKNSIDNYETTEENTAKKIFSTFKIVQ